MTAIPSVSRLTTGGGDALSSSPVRHYSRGDRVTGGRHAHGSPLLPVHPISASHVFATPGVMTLLTTLRETKEALADIGLSRTEVMGCACITRSVMGTEVGS